MTLGQRIKKLRKQNHMTQTDLAQTLGVTKGTVSTWETNSRNPGFETLMKMCDMFSVNLDYLMGRSDDPTPSEMTDEEKDSLARDTVSEELTEYALKYVRLDEYGRSAVESIIQAEYRRCRAENTLLDGSGFKVSVRISADGIAKE